MLIYRVMSQPLGNREGNIARALSGEGHNVSAVKLDWGGKLPSQQNLEGIKIENLEVPDFGGVLKQAVTLPTACKTLWDSIERKEFDILYTQHPFLLPLALAIKSDRDCKVVYDAYEMYSIDTSRHVPGLLSGSARRLFEFFENRLVERTDCVLTVDSLSNFLKRRYKKLVENVEVLYNVPELNSFPDKSKVEELKKRYGEKSILVHVGGISKNRGLMQMLETVDLLDREDFKLLMIGRFKDLKKKALKYVEENDLEDKVEFIEWLPYEEMLSYLEVADVALALYQPIDHQEYTSKGNSRKIFTYMQAGLPIVGPGFKEKGEVIREEDCGILIDTTNPPEIAEAIRYMLENREESRAMGERGHKAIEKKYNWKKEKEKLIKAFTRLEDSP